MTNLGTVSIIEEDFLNIKKITFAWTSVDSGGDAGKAAKTTVNNYTGEVIRLVTIPGTVGDQPSDNYNVIVLDSSGVDILMSNGLLRDQTSPEQVPQSLLGCVVDSKLTLSVNSAGNAKKGIVYLYIRG